MGEEGNARNRGWTGKGGASKERRQAVILRGVWKLYGPHRASDGLIRPMKA